MAVIGNTTQGATTRTFNANCKGISTGAFPANATVNSISGYFSGTSGERYQACLFASDGSTLLATSAERTDITTVALYAFTGGTLDGYSLTSGTTYYVCIATLNASGGLIYFNSGTETYDGITANNGCTGLSPVTLGTGGMVADSTRDYSIQMDYTESGGGGAVGWGPLIAGQRNRRVIAA